MKYPPELLQPVKKHLVEKLRELMRSKKRIDEIDPAKDENRISGNADVGDEAMEKVGLMESSALRMSVDRRVIQLRKALARIKFGSYGVCEKCGSMIDTDRLMIMPEATLCMKCEREKEKKSDE